jgi:hypothetical protein
MSANRTLDEVLVDAMQSMSFWLVVAMGYTLVGYDWIVRGSATLAQGIAIVLAVATIVAAALNAVDLWRWWQQRPES